MDTGERRVLPAADGHMIRAWNGLSGAFAQSYDALRRPLRRTYTPPGGGTATPVDVLLYGEAQRDAAAARVAVPPLRFRRGGHQRALRLRRQPDRQHSRSAARPVRAGVLERAGWRR